MPTAPPRICPRCKRAITGRRCTTCNPAWHSNTNTYAGSGSTRAWRKLRAQHLAQHPTCQAPNCPRLATEVDHITNVGSGGDRYDPHNLQSLCEPHHATKTAAEARRTRPTHPQG